MFFNESMDLLKRMNRLGLSGKGENEYLAEAKDAPDYEKGIIRKVKYELSNKRLKLTYVGRIMYIDLPPVLPTRDDIYKFIQDLFDQLNQAIYPVKLEAKKEKNQEAEEEEE